MSLSWNLVIGSCLLAIILVLIIRNRIIAGKIAESNYIENALIESDERLRATFGNMIEGAQIIGFDWRYLYVNDSVLRHGRTTREAMLGKTMMEVYPGIENTEVFARLKECMEKRVRHRMDNEFVYPDWDKGWFRLSMQPVSEGIFVLSEDITEQKHAEEQLRQANERMRRLIDANIVGIVIATPTGAVLETNDYYLSMIGYTREEFDQGKVNWRSITPPEWLVADDFSIEELREKGVCTPYEKEYVKRDGSRVSVFLSDTMLPGPGEHIAAFVLDITERKRAEEQIKEQMEELRRWHDVMLGREDRVQELKGEVNELCRRIGEPVRYPSQEEKPNHSEIVIKEKS